LLQIQTVDDGYEGKCSFSWKSYQTEVYSLQRAEVFNVKETGSYIFPASSVITIYLESYTKIINPLRKNAEFFNVKAGSSYICLCA